MRQAAVFIHLGRCGILGTSIPSMAKALAMPPSTVCAIIGTLRELKLVTDYGRSNGQGRARKYVVTVAGWKVLTTPPNLSMFQPQMALSEVGRHG